MYKIFLGFALLVAILFMAFMNYARAEFKSNFNYSAVMEVKNTTFIMNIRAKLPSGYDVGPYKSICFSFGDKYIIALSHATDLKKILPKAIHNSVTYWIGDDELKLVGRYEDISLFRSEIDRTSIPLGDSDQLKYGTYIVVVGHSLSKLINLKDGMVSIPFIGDEFVSNNPFPESKLRDTFLITVPMNPGDSGSPVIAFREEVPEIIGIACMVFNWAQGMNFAFKSNYVLEAISKILEE